MAGYLVGFVAQPMTASLHLLCWPALSHKKKKYENWKYQEKYITDHVLIRVQFLFLRHDTAIKNEKIWRVQVVEKKSTKNGTVQYPTGNSGIILAEYYGVAFLLWHFTSVGTGTGGTERENLNT